MAIRIGHASTSRGNLAYGDQSQHINSAGYDTTGEVLFATWYLHPANGWDALIRAKDPLVAEKMAVAMEQACNNSHIGYYMDSDHRRTLDTEAKKHGYDLSKVDVDCACDCSSLIGICIKAAGIDNSLPTTSNMPSHYGAKTKHFEVLRDYIHTHTELDLKRGDVIVKEGYHTIMVVGDSPLSYPPIINSVTDEDYNTIICNLSVKGLSGITTSGRLYYKYNSTTVSTDYYDSYINLNVADNQIITFDRKDTTVKKVALQLVQYNSTGTTLFSNIVVKDLIATDTVIQMYYKEHIVNAKPMIYIRGKWRKVSPMIYTNGQWTEIRNEI